jgi:hypothetical protein
MVHKAADRSYIDRSVEAISAEQLAGPVEALLDASRR